MITILKKQYELIRGSRNVVLDFIEREVGEGLNTPVPAFGGNTIRYFLVHNADCYLNWLAYFALKQPRKSINNQDFVAIDMIRELYGRVDEIVAIFLENFEPGLNVPVSGIHNRAGEVCVTPLQLFTHVTTHEFHHKGQIMTMCRLLGHTPPDTDVIRF
jgi:uncharacterized damage-inducible protein DinB